MTGLNRIRELGVQRLLAVLALIGAIGAAYGAYSILTWPGIAYYTICIAALLFVRDPKVTYLLWFAVVFHAVVTVAYPLWLWHTQQIIPCIYCFAAFCFALIAAMIMYRLPVAVLPVLLMAGMLYAWPYAFALEPKATANPISDEVQQTVSPVEPEPATDVKTAGNQNDQTGSAEPGKATATTALPNNSPTVSESPQVNTPQPGNTTPPQNTTQPENPIPDGTTGDDTPPGNEPSTQQGSDNEDPGTGSNTGDDKPQSG